MKKNTSKTNTVATVIETKINVAAPARRPVAKAVLTRDVTNRHLTCPECKGKNGIERLNQKCDFCGFMLLVRLFPDHSRYIRGLDVTASGRDTYDIGDATADDLRGLNDREVVEATARALAQMPIEIGLSVKIAKQFRASGFSWNAAEIENWLDKRYEGRNPGMVRMNCGNILRAAGKRATDEVNA